jgi:hypothetical protein
MEKYNQIRSEVKVGDVFASDGKTAFSDLIKFRTGSPYSHVAICIGFHQIIPGQPKSLLMCESTMTVSKKDDISGEVIKGVQIHKISSRLALSKSKFWWVPLKQPLSQMQEVVMMQWLFKKHSNKTKYDTRQAIGCAIDWWDALGFRNEPDFDKLFCSELVSRAFQIAKVIQFCNASEMSPDDVVGLDVLGTPVEL